MTKPNQIYWLALARVPRLTNNIKRKLLELYSLEELFDLPTATLTSLGLNPAQQKAIHSPDYAAIDAILTDCERHQISLIDFHNEHYPKLLKHIVNPPLVLYSKGNAALLNKPQIAIVGSRSASLSALEHAKRFSYSLSNSGLVITSGLALGVDSAAHRGCLQANGETIAVVATGLDRVYPARNKTLASDILKTNGVIISEYIPGSPPLPGCFPRRNRIITGMSVGTFVIEAKIKSGSLISARLALEQNKEVFALPGAINNPNTAGCHNLIKQGAKLVDCVEDILIELENQGLSGLHKHQVKKIEKTAQQDLFIDPLLSSVDYETTAIDLVVSRSQLPTAEVVTRLMTLELRGLVTTVPGGYIKLK